MRIRKRFHLLSSLSSDPQVMNDQSSVVQVQVQQQQNGENGHPELQCKKENSQKSDLKNQAFDGQLSVKPTWVSQTQDSLPPSKDLEVEEVNHEKRRVVEEEDEEVKENSKIDIIIRKECTLNEQVNISSLAPFSAPSRQDGLEVPLKKKKWSFERRKKEDDHYSKNPEWKSKINKRCPMFQDDDNLRLLAKATEENVGDVIGNSSSTRKGKKIRGSVILEGSRCSRINGRGWRCCQPTLVGYSLCEHHLGKGRLRSISSSVTAPNLKKKQPLGTSVTTPNDDDDDGDDDEQTQELPSWFRRINNNQEKLAVGMATKDIDGGDGDDDDEKVSQVVVKTRRKLGKVRARSMSSLLVAIDKATMAASQQPRKH